MNRAPSLHALRCSAVAAIACAVSACTTTPSPPASPSAGQQAVFEGTVVSVDTRPWAYDGHAIVVVSSAAAGTVQVQLPARWNLCKAEPPDDVHALAAEDRVQVAGTVTEPGIVVVCEQPQHHLRRK